MLKKLLSENIQNSSTQLIQINKNLSIKESHFSIVNLYYNDILICVINKNQKILKFIYIKELNINELLKIFNLLLEIYSLEEYFKIQNNYLYLIEEDIEIKLENQIEVEF